MPPVNIHINGTQALVFFLMIVVMFGALHLLALSHPSSSLSRGWLGLGF